MTCEGYFGHRTRLYELDIYNNPEKIASIIVKAYEKGVRAMNIPNDSCLLDAIDIAKGQGADMKIIGTVGHTDVNYLAPNFKKAREEVDYLTDIEILSNYDTPLMLVDDILVDGYDWDYTAKVLEEIKDHNIIPGIITSYPFKTSGQLVDDCIDLDLFDYYMVPVNKIAYTMDVDFFVKEQQEELKTLLNQINKKVIISRILACGIQSPKEAFDFLEKLDYADMVTVSAASEREADETFGLLLNK